MCFLKLEKELNHAFFVLQAENDAQLLLSGHIRNDVQAFVKVCVQNNFSNLVSKDDSREIVLELYG